MRSFVISETRRVRPISILVDFHRSTIVRVWPYRESTQSFRLPPKKLHPIENTISKKNYPAKRIPFVSVGRSYHDVMQLQCGYDRPFKCKSASSICFRFVYKYSNFKAIIALSSKMNCIDLHNNDNWVIPLGFCHLYEMGASGFWCEIEMHFDQSMMLIELSCHWMAHL